MPSSANIQFGKVELSAKLAAWTVRYLFRLTFIASAIMAAISISFLFYAAVARGESVSARYPSKSGGQLCRDHTRDFFCCADRLGRCKNQASRVIAADACADSETTD